MIWKREINLQKLNAYKGESLNKLLDITFTEIGPDFITARMPVNEKTIQPFGILHGGASVVLAETVGSVASLYCIPEDENKIPVGISINANHLKTVLNGEEVFGRANAISIGNSLHVWDVRITNSKGDIICISRLTTMIIEKRK